jgi:hypothetical protein
MASRLPPTGSGYSGRSASSGRYGSKSAATTPRTTGNETSRSATSGKSSKYPPKGSAGVSRAK